MSRVEVDTSRFPLILQRLHFGYTEDDMRQGLARYRELFARGQRYAIAVTHEPGAKAGNAQMRKLIGAFQNEHADSIKRLNVAMAIVLPSITHRAAMTGINWLFPPVAPQRACVSVLEAVDYCCEMLTAERIALTPPILALQEELRRRMGYSRPAPFAKGDDS
jgi:hypothetical protein